MQKLAAGKFHVGLSICCARTTTGHVAAALTNERDELAPSDVPSYGPRRWLETSSLRTVGLGDWADYRFPLWGHFRPSSAGLAYWPLRRLDVAWPELCYHKRRGDAYFVEGIVTLIVYYVVFMIVGDFAAYFLGLFTEYEWGSQVSLIVFLVLYFLFLWVSWVLAVRVTKPKTAEQQSS